MSPTAPQPATDRAWSIDDAERWLLSLERFGMTFGLGRMRRVMTALGSPQERLRAVHVVGSNGKSSTVRMIAAILACHGLRAGAYLSPHLVSFAERVRVDGDDLDPDSFAEAVRRAARAAAAVNRTLPTGEVVTQFEAITAAAYDELARREVDVAVVEAGLGGRYDATSVIASEVQVLTSVSLEHTQLLGPTIADIAAEKLDVVRPGATLTIGARLHPEALAVAERVCGERGARLVRAPAEPPVPLPGAAPYQRRNFALAATAARELLGGLDADALADAAASARAVPGRFDVVADRPVTIFDGAHNADGARALAEALRGFLAGRRLVACVAVLDDKDAVEMLRELLGLCAELIFTSVRNPRALPAATLESLARQLGGPPVRVVADPHEALAAARAAAGEGGVALATGSLYLLADLLRGPGAPRGSML